MSSKIVDHEEEHSGDDELWIVSYADMVTLLFGFFVILYSFSTIDDEKFDQMSEKMAEAFKSKVESRTSDADGDLSEEARRIRALQMLVSMLNLGESLDEAVPKIEKSFASGKLAEGAEALLVAKVAGKNKQLVTATEQGVEDEFQTVELVMPAANLFPSGGYRLSKQAVAGLQGLAQDLRHVTDLATIEIIGHTDGQAPTPNPVYDSNFVLSALRAGAVATALTQYGVDGKKLTVRGMANLKPLVPEIFADGRPNPANMAKNRRVGILLKVRRAHAATSH